MCDEDKDEKGVHKLKPNYAAGKKLDVSYVNSLFYRNYNIVTLTLKKLPCNNQRRGTLLTWFKIKLQ